jgi:mannosyltransferase
MVGREARVVAGLVLMAGLVRFFALGHQSLDGDEAVTAVRVLHPNLGGTLSVVVHLERSPPGYYILIWVWTKVFGTGVAALRSLSALFGTLTVPAVYLAARELASKRAGLIAAALTAVSPFLVWYSQEARSYALMALFAAWALYFFARAHGSPTAKNLRRWALFSALALCSHYFAVFLIIPEGLVLIAPPASRRRALVAVGAIAVVGLALLPLAIAQEGNKGDVTSNGALASRIGGSALRFVASEEPRNSDASAAVEDFRLGVGILAASLIAIAALVLVRFGTSRDKHGAALAASIGAAAFLTPCALALIGPDFIVSRNMIGALVPLVVAAGIAFSVPGRRAVAALCGAGTVALSAVVLVAVYSNAQMQRVDWRPAARAVAPLRSPTVFVLPRVASNLLAYYLHAREISDPGFARGIWTRRIDVVSRFGNPFAASPPPAFKPAARQTIPPDFTLRRYEAPYAVRLAPRKVASRRERAGWPNVEALTTSPP